MIARALHHVQLAMPEAGEDRARAFYGDILGIPEVKKPTLLLSRGGVWFENGLLRVHLGVEQDFKPAKKPIRPFSLTILPSLSNAFDNMIVRSYLTRPFRISDEYSLSIRSETASN